MRLANRTPPAVLRLPNPKGDIDHFVAAYCALYDSLESKSDFGIDDGVLALVGQRMLSSSGAVGNAAIARSTRKDRSRDPLFNQFKMFSELYRLLGWFHTSSSKGRFTFTPLGKYIASYSGDIQTRLIEESLLGITLPNDHSLNVGVVNSRPFGLLLSTMVQLDGDLSRDEMILSIYTVADDQDRKEVQARSQAVRTLRDLGDFPQLASQLTHAARGRQVNTLKNYTRFMIGSIRRIGWTVPVSRSNTYNRTLKFDRLTERGRKQALALAERRDIRSADIADANVEARAALCVAAHYGMLSRAGINIGETTRHRAEDALATAGTQISCVRGLPFDKLQYSPYQQASAGALRKAEE